MLIHDDSCKCYNMLIVVIDKEFEKVMGFVFETFVIRY